MDRIGRWKKAGEIGHVSDKLRKDLPLHCHCLGDGVHLAYFDRRCPASSNVMKSVFGRNTLACLMIHDEPIRREYEVQVPT